MTGNFVASQMFTAKGAEFLAGNGSVGRNLHHCHDALAPFRIGEADDTRFYHLGMLTQRGFYLRWVDVFAARHNQIAAPLHQEEVAVGVEVAEVASVDCMINRRGRGER